MEATQNQLVFSEDGKSVWIEFSNGKESFTFDTKEDAINAVLDCLKKKKISDKEVSIFMREIFLAEDLEWSSLSNIKTIEISIGIKIPKIDNPSFKRCCCKGILSVHGYFYNGDGRKILPFEINNQIEGQYVTDLLCESGEIDEITRSTLNTMIDLAGLPMEPVDPNLN